VKKVNKMNKMKIKVTFEGIPFKQEYNPKT
jgi:hypothetical protein